MNKKSFAIFIVAVVIVGGVYFLKKDPSDVVAPSPSTESVKIGWVGPLTGELANLGKDTLASTQIAVDEVNVAGGINGRKIELVTEDGKCNAKDGSVAANKLINVDKVAVMLAMCSPEVNTAADMANTNKVVVLSSCASAPNVTDAGDYIFRTYPSDSFQGVYAANYAYNTLGKRKVAILAMQNDWGLGLEKVFKQKFESLGGQVVVLEEFYQESRDLRSQITKVKSSDAEMIYFPAFTESALAGLKQIKELGVNLPILGGDAWDDPKIHTGDFAQGVFFVTPQVNFNNAWKTKMIAKGAGTTVCAPSAYDNVKILADIIARVGDNGEKIKSELYKVKDYAGVNGNITIDQNGDLATAAYDVKKVENKKAEIVK